MQHCHRCKENKSLDNFWKCRANKNGYGKECKSCNRARWHTRPKRSKEHLRKGHLKRTYGITLEQELIMFNEQQGKCLICTRHRDTLKNRLHVDHDHVTGKVRGLLCFNCNQMLGNARDSLMVLEAAIKYLKR